MNAVSPEDQETAVAWAVRTSDPDFDDWPAFVAWLDGDHARNHAFDAAVIAIAEIGDAFAALPPGEATVIRFPASRPVATARSRRWIVAAGGLALAAGVAGVMLIPGPSDDGALRIIDTMPGRSRSIALADGSRIDLAGGSRLRLDPSTPRLATLERGRAMFVIRHDAARPFQVTAGGYRIVDVGTAFEVVQQPAGTAVSVAEGEVIVDPATHALRLTPGDMAQLRTGSRPDVSRIAPASIGQWRHARMNYRDASLVRVAGDLSAATGRPIAVDRRLAERRFTGSIAPASFRDRPDELAAAFDVAVREDPGGWTLRPR